MDGYLDQMMRTAWTAVPAELLERACAHVAAHDFPEALSELLRMGEEAGFRSGGLLGRFGRHAVIGFEASPAA